MGVRPNTGNSFKGFTFDGIDSKNYGVYITQEAAFDAAERDVELISIAGRNGAYALDRGRFLNVTVTYKAGITATDESSFTTAISDFRNELSSRRGYCRLEDDYNTDEYRLAVYKGGLEVNAADILKAGEFTISFDCQPQRYLKTGEIAESVTSGDVLNNPTLFEAKPLLSVTGYGSLTIGDHAIGIVDAPVGNVALCGASSVGLFYKQAYFPYKNGDFLDNADRINIPAGSQFIIAIEASTTLDGVNDPVITPASLGGSSVVSVGTSSDGVTPLVSVDVTLNATYFSAGTALSKACDISVDMLFTSGGISTLETFTATLYVIYKPSLSRFEMVVQNTDTTNAHYVGGSAFFSGASGISSQRLSARPIYIDTEIGEAYAIEGDEVISVNPFVSLGADLPVLYAGNNTITYDNTFSAVSVTPRWWRV